MPKIKVNNTQGLVQSTGGGIALFGATQTLVAAASAGTDINSTTSLALCTSTNNAHFVNLPATGSLDTGHTVLVANIDDAQDIVLRPKDTAGGQCINGQAGTTITLGEKAVALCIYSGGKTPGWIILPQDAATLPS